MGESCPKLLDLIPKEREWGVNREGFKERRNGSVSDENKKLELRLGLPGDEGWAQKDNSFRERNNESILSLKYLPDHQKKKPFSPPSALTAVPNTSQKRAAPAPVVGWPPIRSFRKNLASTSSAKAVSEPEIPIPTKQLNEKPLTEKSSKGLFVKINMDGVPIGRKVDLNAYDRYDKLSSAVDKLFRGLLAAQRDSGFDGIENKEEEQKPITGLLDGSREYTLVYEDNEGDRMLVGDVPWHMFVSTVKRLRVLKSSDLPNFGCSGSKEGKVQVENLPK